MSGDSRRVFDLGLQLERTALSWRRTALSLLVAALISARLMALADAHVLVTVVVLFVGLSTSTLISLFAQRRYQRAAAALLAEGDPQRHGFHLPGGRALALVVASQVLAGVAGLVWILTGGQPL